MTSTVPSRLLKTLSANDLGQTGTHQSGIHVPKSVTFFFPPLHESILNPSAWIVLHPDGLGSARCRFIHYNGRVLGVNTRDEYRITSTTPLLRKMNAEVGDVLQFEFIESHQYRIVLLRSAPVSSEDRVVIALTSGWKTVSLRR